VRAGLNAGAVLVNAGVFDAELDRSQHRVFGVPREMPARSIHFGRLDELVGFTRARPGSSGWTLVNRSRVAAAIGSGTSAAGRRCGRASRQRRRAGSPPGRDMPFAPDAPLFKSRSATSAAKTSS
jgi:hypothetical protein